MSTRHEQIRRDTRVRVLEAARRLFVERGVAQTTVVDIASAARISRATFFNHFGSKEELLVALWSDQVGNLGDQIAAHLAEPRSTHERIRSLFAHLLEALQRRRGYLEVVVAELERTSSEGTLAARSAVFQEHLRTIIDAGVAQGDVPTDRDPQVMTEMVASIYLGVLRNLRWDPTYDAATRIPAASVFIADAVCGLPIHGSAGPVPAHDRRSS